MLHFETREWNLGAAKVGLTKVCGSLWNSNGTEGCSQLEHFTALIQDVNLVTNLLQYEEVQRVTENALAYSILRVHLLIQKYHIENIPPFFKVNEVQSAGPLVNFVVRDLPVRLEQLGWINLQSRKRGELEARRTSTTLPQMT